MNWLYAIIASEFMWPWFLAAPLVVFIAVLWRRSAEPAAPHVSIPELRHIPVGKRVYWRRTLLPLFSVLFVVFLSLAAARPIHETKVDNPHQGRNLVLTLDVSPSMGAQDFSTDFDRITRLDAVKAVVKKFIQGREGDRIALVVFAGTAYLQAPLTPDLSLVHALISRLQVGMAGDGTAIGDGLGLAIKRIEEVPAESRAIILLTDGVNNSGQINPMNAANIATELGIKVYTIGIGSDESTTIAMPGGLMARQVGGRGSYDEAALKEIASKTGGEYYHATSLDGLETIYQEIDKLEKTESKERSDRIIQELYGIPALIALICYILYLVFAHAIFPKVP